MALLGPRPRALHAAALAACLALAAGSPPLHAGPSEYELKAAFLYQIVKFVELPAAGEGSLTLCVLGGNPFGPLFDSLAEQARGTRRIAVRPLDASAEPAGCAMLYVAPGAERHLDRVVALARGSGMLTLGDSEGFARRGVMLNFYPEQDKLRFEINLEAARLGRVTISSRLLSLARIVDAGAAR